jgi:hypothetical protein
MLTKLCTVPGHPHFLRCFRLTQGTPTTITLCADVTALDAPPAEGLLYFWAKDEADLWAFVDVEGQAHPVYAISAREWAALRAGAPVEGLR